MAGRKIKCWYQTGVGGSNHACWHGYCPCHLLNWAGPGVLVLAAIREHLRDEHPVIR